MPNHFAFIALFSWPVVVFFLFRSMSRTRALLWSVFGGYLLLPYGVGINPPVLPTLDKTLIPVFSAMVMCFLMPDRPPLRRRPAAADTGSTGSEASPAPAPRNGLHATRRSGPPPRDRGAAAPRMPRMGTKGNMLINVLIALMLITPIITLKDNGAPISIGVRTLPGLRLYDALSLSLSMLVSVLPFLLGRRYLGHPRQHVDLLTVLCLSGLAYTLPTLFEVRMSPQLSRWVYGFLAQSFAQTTRDGSYRPVVFLQHGLWLAIFMAMVALAAFTLWRQKRAEKQKSRWLFAGAYLAAVLVLCHSLGALAEFLLLVPFVLLGSVRSQLIMASVVAVSILTYPTLRGTGLVPVNQIYEFTNNNISPKRAQSFQFRLMNEDRLLAHANQRPVAGWGGWGRSRVYNDKGYDISTTDGMWVIIIGVSGWLGYIAEFGLLAVPILMLTLRRRAFGVTLATSGLCLALAANLIDLIPNATLTPVTWLIAGALAGRYRLGSLPLAETDTPEENTAEQAASRRRPAAGARPRTA